MGICLNNSFVPLLPKILFTLDQSQEDLLSSWVKTTAASINKTWVKSVTNNAVFQVGETFDTSPGEFTHHCISPFLEETLLLQISYLEAHLKINLVTVLVQFFIAQTHFDVTDFLYYITRIFCPINMLDKNKLQIDRVNDRLINLFQVRIGILQF